jgi:hypothetical protein
LARRKEELLKPLAKENLSVGGKRGAEVTNQGSAKLPKAEPIDTRKQSAKTAGVGERSWRDSPQELSPAQSEVG